MIFPTRRAGKAACRATQGLDGSRDPKGLSLSDNGEASAPGGAWFVLHTKSRQEKILANELGAMRVSHYLPLVRRQRVYGARKAVVEEPLFPGYVFLFGSADQAYQADRTKRVANIIRVTDQRRLEWELQNIKLALSQNANLDPYPHLVKGVRVEVRSGPFQGLQGIIEDRGKDQRLILQVDVLGRAVTLEIQGAMVEPVRD
jgi:transcriptional antiterminator NusG